jgi:hypothetical protein
MKKIKVYYDHESDIMCIAQPDGKLYKFIGEFCRHADLMDYLQQPVNKWYVAQIPPDEYIEFDLIGEL